MTTWTESPSHSAAISGPSLRQFLLVFVLAIVVYGYRLGEGGFVNSEGHRVASAWEMLDTGDYLTPRLFGQIYVRKPPGFQWALATSATLFGRNEWSARLVGAGAGVAMVALAYLFAFRWFGPTAALYAGLAQLSLPMLWKYQRSAEIEGWNNLLAQFGTLLLLDALVVRPSLRMRPRLLMAGGIGAIIFASVLAKGPAALPCYVGVILAAMTVDRSFRPLRSLVWWGAVGIALVLTAASFCWLWVKVTHAHETVAAQRVFGFHWNTRILLGMFALVPLAFAQNFPHSLWALVPWMQGDAPTPEMSRAGRTVAWASIYAVIIYAVVGLTNPRYAMPSFTFISVLAGPVIVRWQSALTRSSKNPKSLQFACGALLALCWFVFVHVMEPMQRSSSGRAEGRRLGDLLPDGAQIWADGLIDARPETFAYARIEAKRLGHDIQIHWRSSVVQSLGNLPEGSYVALRTDNGEWDEFIRTTGHRSHQVVAEGKVYKFPYRLARLTAAPAVVDRRR